MHQLLPILCQEICLPYLLCHQHWQDCLAEFLPPQLDYQFQFHTGSLSVKVQALEKFRGAELRIPEPALGGHQHGEQLPERGLDGSEATPGKGEEDAEVLHHAGSRLGKKRRAVGRVNPKSWFPGWTPPAERIGW